MATYYPTGSSKRRKINNFDFYDENHIYLLFNENWWCYKIGVSQSVKKRIEKHKLNGFRLIDMQRRSNAREIELKILGFIKAHGFPTGEDLFEYQFDGWNECWHKEDLAPKNINHLINLANEYEHRYLGRSRQPVLEEDYGTIINIHELDFEELFALNEEAISKKNGLSQS